MALFPSKEHSHPGVSALENTTVCLALGFMEDLTENTEKNKGSLVCIKEPRL